MNENNKQNKQFLMVDYEILKISEIVVNGKKEKFNDASKNIYCYIRNWPEAFPSHNKIAEVFGITRKAAEQRIKKLLELGLIERIERPGTSNLYHVKPITEEMKTGRSYSENKGTNYEDKTGGAMQYLKQQPQESPAETTDKRQYQQVKEPDRAIASHDDGAVSSPPPGWDDVPTFSESDYQNVPPHYYEEEEGQEDIAPTPEPEKVDQKDFDLAKKTICAAAAFAGIGWDKCFTLLRKNFNLNDATKRALMNDVDAKARVELVEDKVDEWENVPF
ncbi:hypothetical protein [Serratia rhizosphaerae]